MKLTVASESVLNVVEVVPWMNVSEEIPILVFVGLHVKLVCAAGTGVGVPAATKTAKQAAAGKLEIQRYVATIFVPLRALRPNELPSEPEGEQSQ